MKRSAASELNRDNWDEDDEPEEAGTFKPLGQEELSKRVIKVAKRRLPKSSDEQKPLFANFDAFGKSSNNKPSDGKSAFSFLSNLNGSSTQTSQPSTVKESSTESSSKEQEENLYLKGLKTLNECLLNWLDKCIKKNPSCILSPIFKDYEKHLESLNKPVASNSETPKPSESLSNFKFNFASHASSQSTSVPSQNILSNISSPVSSTSSLKNPKPSGLSNSPLYTPDWLSKPVTFSNLASAPSAVQTPLFGNVSNAKTTAPSEENKEGEDDDSPPSNDFKPVKEDDAIFSQRVKLFVQNKDKQFSDRGVGTLFIKEAPGGTGKIYQAVMRADTSLGNVLLNIRLSADIPARVRKNNVMLVCVPTPDSKPPPVPVLLRVKTEQEAERLLEEINKYK